MRKNVLFFNNLIFFEKLGTLTAIYRESREYIL